MKRIVLVVALAGLTLVASTEARAADIEAVLDDAAGASAFSVKDSGSVEGAHIDSDGNMVIKGGLRLDSSGVENTTAENLIVDGNVGIGTTVPGEKLEVAGGLIKIPLATGTDNDSPGIVVVSNDDFLYDGEYINHYGLGWHTYNDGAENGGNAYLSGYYGLDLFTGGQERLRINNNGNVGIGTTAPGKKLDVSGDIRASGETIGTLGSGYGQFRAIAGNYGTMFRNDGSDSYFLLTASGDQNGGWNTLRPFRLYNSSGDVSLGNGVLYVQHNGNVGIGTTSPGGNLDIAAAVNPILKLTDTTNPKSWHMVILGDSDLSFTETGIADGRLYLKAGGNVGIGTTGPQSKLQVDGGYIQLDDGNTAAPAAADCDAAAEEGRMYWDATNDNCYICSGASGWRKIATVAP